MHVGPFGEEVAGDDAPGHVLDVLRVVDVLATQRCAVGAQMLYMP